MSEDKLSSATVEPTKGAESTAGARIIVCGGRDFLTVQDYELLDRSLKALTEGRAIGYVFHGNARGADKMAAGWFHRNYPRAKVFACPADWSRHGRAAGPIRNRNMLGNKIDLVVAFPGGKGTRDMIKAARAAGVPVMEIAPATPPDQRED